MDPVTVNIILSTVGWLASTLVSRAVDVAWKQFTKKEKLDAEINDLTEQLKCIKIPVEAAEPEDLKQVKELVYEAKNLLDELDYFKLQEEVNNINPSFSKGKLKLDKKTNPSFSKGELKILDKKTMSTRMTELTNKLKLRQESLNPVMTHQLLSSIAKKIHTVNDQAVLNGRRTTSYFLGEKIYGRKGEQEQIMELIKGERTQKLPVIAIVGNGGIGKTTLAQLVYDKLPPSDFTKIWISVSTNFDEKQITRQMLQCCSPDSLSYDGDSNDNFLKRKLEKYLKEKNFFLVLDDIWDIKSKKDWASLLAPLNPHEETKTGNMVLVTTRDLSIAKMVSTTDPIYLNSLDDSSFWSLFKHFAFGHDGNNVPKQLEITGREIVKKLCGNPLAAKTVGSLLKGESDIIIWDKILESEQWMFQEGDDDIMPALKLSYDYLPFHLQQCFSYCALFPKASHFKAEELVRMWMAQGFIHTNNKRVEDAGFQYLKELVERAFFQKVVKSSDVVYAVHDLMHDLAQVVSSEELLAMDHSQPIPEQHCLRHLSFLLDVEPFIENRDLYRKLCSLVIFENNRDLPDKDKLKWDQAKRFSLRLLIIRLPHWSESNKFNHLIHLRYLGLNVEFIHRNNGELLAQICTLYHLQVLEFLVLGSRDYVTELPKQFNNLVNLRHFIARKEWHSKIYGVGRLKHLQELKQFVVHQGEEGFNLGQLSELMEIRGSLEILNLENVKEDEARSANLSCKEIVELNLSWTKGTSSTTQNEDIIRHAEKILEDLKPTNDALRKLCIQNYRGRDSPSWLIEHSIKYVESISLSNCEAWEKLPNFGQLMCLKELNLDSLAGVRKLGKEFHGCGPQKGFPALEVMKVRNMNGLETWVWDEQGNIFPSLKVLTIENCLKMKTFSILTVEEPPIFTLIDFSQSKGELLIKHVTVSKVLDFLFKGFKNINSLIIEDCPHLTSLSWKYICMLQNLKMLEIKNCPELCIPVLDEEENGDGGASNLHKHKSLEEIKIEKCAVSGADLSDLLLRLPRIRKLLISDCKKINTVPSGRIINQQIRSSLTSPEKLTNLRCVNMYFTGRGYLRQTASKNVATEDCQKFLPVNLQELSIGDVPAMNNMVWRSLTVHTLIVHDSNITSVKLGNFVQKLELRRCMFLTVVEGPNSPAVVEGSNSPAVIEGPNSLASAEVFIQKCPQLSLTQTSPKFTVQLENLQIDNIRFLLIHGKNFSSNLCSLTITAERLYFGVKLGSPWKEWTKDQEDALQLLTALQNLTLDKCTYLCSLPGTYCRHPSLKTLTVIKCPEITSLPPQGLPDSLQKLHLGRDCSEDLRRQCSDIKDFEYTEDTCYQNLLVYRRKGSSVD